MNSQSASLRARNLRTLAALAGLFLLPLVLAFFMYYATPWRPAARVNHGTLITPPRPLPAVSLPRVSLAGGTRAVATDAAHGPAAAAPVADSSADAALFRSKWSLVYIGDGNCDSSCRAALYVTRQTRLSLEHDMTRVQRVFLATGGCCDREFLAREHADLLLVNAAGGLAQPLLRTFPADDHAHTLFIVDPLGNLMMSYDARQNPHGLLEDLRKLLRLSQIG